MELRPYQEEARQAIEAEWQQGNRKTLLVLPTGTGKTIVFAKVIQDCVANGDRVLVLAHREELLEQASDKLYKACGLATATEMASQTSLGNPARVVVGSVQTMQGDKRLAKFTRDYFDTIVVDEAHHAISDSYQKVLKHFENAKVLGVTATPDRGDMKNLGEYFDSLAYEYKLPKAINEGYLSKIEALTIPLNLDITSVQQTAGDYSAGQLGDALEPYLEQIADEMVKQCQNRKTVVFLPLVRTAKQFTQLLQERGITAAEVDGQSEDREQILADYAGGRYQVLCNSMLLTEGWDCPQVDCIVVLRPTKVRSLYVQMVGRGTRLAPGKESLLLLDFLWNTERHELCHPANLITTNDKVAKKMTEQQAESEEATDLQEAEEKAERDVVQEREDALKKRLEEVRHKRRKLVDPLQFEMSIQDLDLANYQPAFGWEMGPMSDKQSATLERFGIDPTTIGNAGKASVMITRLIKRSQNGFATPKQIHRLEIYGFQNVGMWSFEAAKSMIGRIAANHWRVPYNINVQTFVPSN